MHDSSELELQFERLWDLLYPNIDLWKEEEIIPDRKFRFDYVNKEAKVAIEINGGIWAGKMGHNSGKGLLRDYEKNALAIANGYVCFWLAQEMFTEEMLGLIARVIYNRYTTLSLGSCAQENQPIPVDAG